MLLTSDILIFAQIVLVPELAKRYQESYFDHGFLYGFWASMSVLVSGVGEVLSVLKAVACCPNGMIVRVSLVCNSDRPLCWRRNVPMFQASERTLIKARVPQSFVVSRWACSS